MIHFLHDFRYWTEYLHPYLDAGRFSLLRSKRSDNSYRAPYLDLKNLEQRDIVVAGHSNEIFGSHTRVLARLQHSPGFGCEAFLHGYRWVHNSPRRMMLPANVLELLKKTRRLAPNQFALRDHLISNPKLLVTRYDPSLNALYRAPRAAERVPGTILIALNWRITVQPADLQLALLAIDSLARDHAVRVVSHPFSNARWIGSRHHPSLIDHCRKAKIPLATDISREKLLAEYDRAEYVLSDGSGSVYEAVARGCKALLLDNLSYQKGWQIFGAALEAGMLPATRYLELHRHPGAEADLHWLQQLHPDSIVNTDVAPLAAEELVQAFQSW